MGRLRIMAEEMCTIQVSNVPAEAKESELRVFFRFHGDIKAVQYDSGDRSTVLIEYTKSDEAESAQLFDNTSFHGSIIKVGLYDKPHIPLGTSLGAGEPAAPAPSSTSSFQETPQPVFDPVPAEQLSPPEPAVYANPDPSEELPAYTAPAPAPALSPAPAPAPIKPAAPAAPVDSKKFDEILKLSPFDTANSVLVVLFYFSYLCIGSVF